MWGGGAFARSCPNPWGNAAPPTANGVTDDSEYPALPSQRQDSDSQDALEIEMQAPLATALAPPLQPGRRKWLTVRMVLVPSSRATRRGSREKVALLIVKDI